MDLTPNLHKVLGTTLVATWLNLMLYVLVIDRVSNSSTFNSFQNSGAPYNYHYHTDKILFRIAVLATLVCDTATTIAACVDTYINAVTFQGNISALQTRTWPRSLYLASSGISAAVVQAFMLYRYWSFHTRTMVDNLNDVPNRNRDREPRSQSLGTAADRPDETGITRSRETWLQTVK
ncbi:hypothetical protein D9758_009318 [Tetrapyrgos nigripes]|uniref:Uncharacterized protein n=1 Tax=Tetrapyrgos nigripes TaxID=182062 RepID=A0A8H5GGW5_9AGAR|nr:hypothetical protein D9758_009318 [Tetrapyrgos nigripes]